jgi:hypothetical protein
MSGNPTYRDLAAWSDDKFGVADDPEVISFRFSNRDAKVHSL